MKTGSLKQRALSLGLKVLLVSLLFFLATASAYAVTVRGRLDRQDGSGRVYPATYIGVTLNNQQLGRSSPAYSGDDGMYYLYNVPPGEYLLEVWVYPGRDPLVYKVQVYNQPVIDITPILIP